MRLAPAVDLFTEFSYRNIFTKQQLAPAPIEGDVEDIAVPAANPFNPFGDDVFFRYRVTEAGPRVDEIDTDVYRALAGLNIRLSPRWNSRPRCSTARRETEDKTLQQSLAPGGDRRARRSRIRRLPSTSSAPATT